MNLTTGYPYALVTNGLPATYPKLEKSIKAEVVIIGGGISGALTAYYLINAGIDCIVVDGRTIGLGSTCANTSLLQYELDQPLSMLCNRIGKKDADYIYKLSSRAIDTLEGIAGKIKFKHFERQESLFFAAHSKDLESLEDEYTVRRNAGFDVEWLTESELKKQFGLMAPSGILSAQGATTEAYLLTHALLQYSQEKGLKVYDRTRVTEINYHPRRVQLNTTNGCTITARNIVNATGYEVTEFIDRKIINLSSTYAIASEHWSENKLPWKRKAMLWNTANPYLYMRMTEDHRIIIGGRDEEFHSAHKRDALIRRKTAWLKRDFEKLFPGVEFIPEFSWTGVFGSTKDSLPYIGMYPKTPHTYYALGFGGNGITFSVIAAEIIRDMILGKKKRRQKLFSFSR